jgi:hypothetical protein
MKKTSHPEGMRSINPEGFLKKLRLKLENEKLVA